MGNEIDDNHDNDSLYGQLSNNDYNQYIQRKAGTAIENL